MVPSCVNRSTLSQNYVKLYIYTEDCAVVLVGRDSDHTIKDMSVKAIPTNASSDKKKEYFWLNLYR